MSAKPAPTPIGMKRCHQPDRRGRFRRHNPGTPRIFYRRNLPNSYPKLRLTKTYAFGPLSLFAFYEPHASNRQHKYDIRYGVASLPVTMPLRRLGKRRWLIEPFFRDYKSAAWQLHSSALHHPERRDGLLTILAITYLWSTCLGRWLCKTGKRSELDDHPQRHFSLFRIGWDGLVHQYRLNLNYPSLLTLYQ